MPPARSSLSRRTTSPVTGFSTRTLCTGEPPNSVAERRSRRVARRLPAFPAGGVTLGGVRLSHLLAALHTGLRRSSAPCSVAIVGLAAGTPNMVCIVSIAGTLRRS